MSVNQLHEVIIISKHLTSSLLVLKSDTIIQFAKLPKLLISPATKISLFTCIIKVYRLGTYSPEGTVTHTLTDNFLLVKIMSSLGIHGVLVLDFDFLGELLLIR